MTFLGCWVLRLSMILSIASAGEYCDDFEEGGWGRFGKNLPAQVHLEATGTTSRKKAGGRFGKNIPAQVHLEATGFLRTMI